MVIHNESLKSGIFAKLDWFSCMFQDVTFNELLSFLDLDPDAYISEFLRSRDDISQGFETKVRFSYESVALEANYYDALKASPSDLFNTRFSMVKLDISGHGLDFLRSTGLDVDNYLRNVDSYRGFKFHHTRVDFAYDLINYMPSLVDDLTHYCLTNCTPTGRVCVLHKTSAYKCSVHCNSEKTVYVGSTSSHRLLRVYDKRLEQIDRDTGIYKFDNIYGNPDSWLRIELQCRRETAQNLLFGKGFDCSHKSFWLSLFRHIYEEYTFSNVADSTKQNRAAADFWQNLFNWEEIPDIIQNQNSVQFVPYGQRVFDDFGRNFGRFLKWLAVAYNAGVNKGYGDREYIQYLINHFLLRLQTEPSEERHWKAFQSQLNVLFTTGCITISDFSDQNGFYREGNRLYFKF